MTVTDLIDKSVGLLFGDEFEYCLAFDTDLIVQWKLIQL